MTRQPCISGCERPRCEPFPLCAVHLRRLPIDVRNDLYVAQRELNQRLPGTVQRWYAARRAAIRAATGGGFDWEPEPAA